MGKIPGKLRSNRGMTLIFSILFFLIRVAPGSAALTTARQVRWRAIPEHGASRVRHDMNKPGEDYKITDKTSVGGLIGEITGVRTVTDETEEPLSAVKECAAAFLVESKRGDAG